MLFMAAHALAINPNHRLTQYVHRVFQAQPGLPQASVYAVSRMRDGYLWLGTQSGAVRFDGARFTPIPALEQAGLSSIWFRKIVEDATGRVWLLAEDSRLIAIDPAGLKVIDDAHFTCLFPGKTGEVWSCTPNGLVKFKGEERQFYPSAESLTNAVTTGCQAADESIWLAGGSTIVFWDGAQYTKPGLHSLPRNPLIRSVLCSSNTVWMATSKGLVRLENTGTENAAEKLYTFNDGLPDNIVITLGQGAGHIWAGTRSGFSRVSGKGIESFGYREGLSQQTVLALLEDQEGSLWVGTGNGLDQFLDGAATRFTANEGLPGDAVGPVIEDRRGKLWTGSPEGGLAVFDGQRFSVVPGTQAFSIQSLAADRDGALWAGTSAGLYQMRDGHVQQAFTQAQGLPSNRILSLFHDREGRLWTGTALGPAVFRDGKFVQDPAFAKSLRVPVAAITETGEGAMMFAVERGGVYVLNGKDVQAFTGSGGTDPPPNEVTTIYTDPEGVTWIGTNGLGLGMLRNGKFSRFLGHEGLVDPEIYGFMADANGRLCMVGSKGFFWVKRSDLFDLAAGKLKKVSLNPYRPQDGARTMSGTSGVNPVATLARDGRLWFSATRALLAFEPDFGSRILVPPVVIEDVSVNGDTSPPERIRKLGPGRENVSIEYTALTFLAPQRLTFRYKLEGYDKDWTDAGPRRQAFYTNLPPGKFKFRVNACGGNAPCNEASTGFDFEILPQFYQRAWFIPSIVALIGLLTWLTHRLHVRQLRSQFALVLGERSRIARELHDTLIQGFSGITMQLQAMKMRIHSTEEKQTLEEIIGDAGRCLRETRRSVAGLRGATGGSGGLAKAIAEAAHHAIDQSDVRLKLQLTLDDEALPAEVKYNLVCIAQEAVANAVKHSEARTIDVALSSAGRQLRLVIRDDGVGLPDRAAGPGHYGMIGMRERAHHIGAQLEFSSFPGTGTTISVCLPLSKPQPLAAVTATPSSLESTR